MAERRPGDGDHARPHGHGIDADGAPQARRR